MSKDFDEWIDKILFNECFKGDERNNLEVAFNAGRRGAARRCKEIALQRIIAENPAQNIATKIDREFYL
jgi:hypothetical protein